MLLLLRSKRRKERHVSTEHPELRLPCPTSCCSSLLHSLQLLPHVLDLLLEHLLLRRNSCCSCSGSWDGLLRDGGYPQNIETAGGTSLLTLEPVTILKIIFQDMFFTLLCL